LSTDAEGVIGLGWAWQLKCAALGEATRNEFINYYVAA
jgi:hypothetical protein